MPYWLFDLLVLALPAGLLLRSSPRLPEQARRAVLRATAALSVVALVWTAPWDEHLVRTGVWSYGPDRVLATIGSVPVEEYAFVVLLVVLVAAWGVRTGRLPARPVVLVPLGRSSAASVTSRASDHRPTSRILRTINVKGALLWVGVALAGAALVAVGGQFRYLGLLLVWVAPPLALQRAVAGDLLRARSYDRVALAAPVALWLCVADRLALADGIWAISPASSTGVLLLGLPLEEAAFFCLTTLLVADGLVLATDPVALARARTLLPWTVDRSGRRVSGRSPARTARSAAR